MNIRSKLQQINSIYHLSCFEVDVFNKIIELFKQKLFYYSKPKFTFHSLKITENYYHFMCNVGGIDCKVSILIENMGEFINKRTDGIKEKYFYLTERTNFYKPDYEKCDFWDMTATIEFDKKQFVADQKKLYGKIGYLYIVIRRLLNK